MKRNIERIINELQHDSKVQAMHRANVAKRLALRERRRAAMLARHHKAVMVYDDRAAKKEAIKQAIYEKYNGDTVKALLGYIPHIIANGFAGKFNQDFDNLFHEAVNEIFKEQQEERERKQKEGEEKEVYTLSNGKKTTDFLVWAQDRIDAREAKKAAIREGIDQKFNGSALLAEMAYVLGNVEKAIKGKEVKINDEFTDLIDECRKEEEARQAEENRIRREEHAEAVKRHNKLIEHAKNVLGRDDREAKKAAIKKAIWEKYDGSTLKARLLFLIEVVQGKYNEEFKELLDEACHEIDAEKAEIRAEKIAKELREEQKNLHKWFEAKAEKIARVTGEDKATIIDRLERGLAA